jgi:hypothetical protein
MKDIGVLFGLNSKEKVLVNDNLRQCLSYGPEYNILNRVSLKLLNAALAAGAPAPSLSKERGLSREPAHCELRAGQLIDRNLCRYLI